MSSLIVKNLSAAYGDLQVLHDISIRVDVGNVVIVLGANGAGKSTLLRSISGQIENIKGSIKFGPQDLAGLGPADIVMEGISQVPEGRRLFPFLTVEDNLRLGAYRLKDRKDIESNLKMVLELFPILHERRHQLAGSLSGGEQQMCAIGRGLASSPKVLLLDEPSLGLAPLLVTLVFKKIEDIRAQGITVLLAEQNVRQALSICDYAYVLESGRILIEGNAEEVSHSRLLEKAYLGI